jgi:hypothetical protein
LKKTLSLFIGLFIFFFANMPLMAEDIVHTVQKGDTLWDISSQYLETPWKWPLVWANNNDITNPHLIYPNDKVIISKRGKKTIITIVSAQEKKEPEIYTPEEIAKEEEKSVVVSPKFSTFIYSPNILKGSGSVYKKHGIGDLASRNEMVLIKSPSGLAPNRGITIVSKVSDIKKDNKVVGYLYKAVAIANVEDFSSDIVKASITYSNQEIKAGDIVFDDLKPIEPMTIQISEPSLKSEGRIIDLYGGITGSSDLDLVFMDLGRSAGVAEGSLLSIYDETVLKEENASFRDYQGMVIVLQSLDNSCMGLVLEVKGPIKKGFVVAGFE